MVEVMSHQKELSSGGQGIVYLTEEHGMCCSIGVGIELLRKLRKILLIMISLIHKNFTNVREYKHNASTDNIKRCCGIYHENVRWHGVI